MEEIWKDIPGYEGYYQVSTFGNVRSLDRIVKGRWGKRLQHGSMMKLSEDFDGYLGVGLTKDGKQRGYRVNRLVAMTFIPNPDNLPIVHHKDNNTKNNRVDNLEWATVQYNTQHAIDTGRLTFDHEHLQRIAKIRGDKLKKPVMCTDTGELWDSIQSCSISIGLGRDALSRHIKNGQPFRGYTYKLVERGS